MSSARSAAEDAAAAPDVAAALREARFVRVIARPDGDALAASGILARALRRLDIPFQVRIARRPTPAVDDGVTVTVGCAGGDVDVEASSAPASVTAYDAAVDLSADDPDTAPDPVLGLAGAVAAGVSPETDATAPLLEVARERDALVRGPGVGAPTADAAEALAYTTFAHAPSSGDIEAARAALADLGLPTDLADADEGARRSVASLLALESVAAESATPRAARSVERALRPYATPTGPFETLDGYADVLDATARERPGVGVALVLGHHDRTDSEESERLRTAALDAWRDHARAAHGALHGATTARYDGLFVARADDVDLDPTGRAATAARLLREFRSPEPVAVVVGRGVAAADADPDADIDVGVRLADAVERLDGVGTGTETDGGATRSVVRFADGVDPDRIASAVREAFA